MEKITKKTEKQYINVLTEEIPYDVLVELASRSQDHKTQMTLLQGYNPEIMAALLYNPELGYLVLTEIVKNFSKLFEKYSLNFEPYVTLIEEHGLIKELLRCKGLPFSFAQYLIENVDISYNFEFNNLFKTIKEALEEKEYVQYLEELKTSRSDWKELFRYNYWLPSKFVEELFKLEDNTFLWNIVQNSGTSEHILQQLFYYDDQDIAVEALIEVRKRKRERIKS